MRTALLLIFIATSAFGQKAILDEPTVPVTTQEEYNYVTKGYKIQLESGLDTKKGYVIKDIAFDKINPSYSFEFKFLIRESTQEIACIMVIAKSITWGNTYYLCIPNYIDSILYNQYLSAVSAWDKPMILEYYRAYTSIAHRQLFNQ